MKTKRKIPLDLMSQEIIDDGNRIRVNFKLPRFNIHPDTTISFSNLFIQWKEKVNDFHGFLSCSLVDFDINNYDQNVLFIFPSGKSKNSSTYITPTHLIEYKTRCSLLDSAVFKISLFCTDENEKNTVKEEREKSKLTSSNIEKIYLQLFLNGTRF